MNASIQGIIDHLFKDTADNAETRALHEELLNNCMEHYEDLIARGMSETEAIDAVVDSLKGMKEVIAEYPRKTGNSETAAETEKMDVPDIPAVEPEKETQKENPSEYDYNATEIRKLKTDMKNCDLIIGMSDDQRIHVRCEDMDGIICEQDGSALLVRIVDKTKKTIEEAGEKLNSQDFSVKGILDFIGKAIGSVASNIAANRNVYINLPSVKLTEMDLNSKSGDIEVKAEMPETLSAHSMSGEINIIAADNGPAGKVNISSMSGDVEFSGNAQSITISSMSGDVEAYGAFHETELKSTSGDAEFEGNASQVRIVSVSGDVSADLRNTSVRSILARSTSGDVDISLADGTDSVHVSMGTVSGTVHCSIPDAGPDADLQIQANSVSGDVTIR